jgi:hypothetical protein
LKTGNSDKIKELKIGSELNLQRFLLNKWLELIESGSDNQKIIALKELSRYSFPSNTYFSSPIKEIFSKEDPFN